MVKVADLLKRLRGVLNTRSYIQEKILGSKACGGWGISVSESNVDR